MILNVFQIPLLLHYDINLWIDYDYNTIGILESYVFKEMSTCRRGTHANDRYLESKELMFVGVEEEEGCNAR